MKKIAAISLVAIIVALTGFAGPVHRSIPKPTLDDSLRVAKQQYKDAKTRNEAARREYLKVLAEAAE